MMDKPPQQVGPRVPKTILDLDADALARCFCFLGIRDIANVAVTCKPVCRVAYSDVVWNRFFREQWPNHPVFCGASGVREQYLARRSALHQLKFEDPFEIYFSTVSPVAAAHILLDRNVILFALEGFEHGH